MVYTIHITSTHIRPHQSTEQETLLGCQNEKLPEFLFTHCKWPANLKPLYLVQHSKVPRAIHRKEIFPLSRTFQLLSSQDQENNKIICEMTETTVEIPFHRSIFCSGTRDISF